MDPVPCRDHILPLRQSIHRHDGDVLGRLHRVEPLGRLRVDLPHVDVRHAGPSFCGRDFELAEGRDLVEEDFGPARRSGWLRLCRREDA